MRVSVCARGRVRPDPVEIPDLPPPNSWGRLELQEMNSHDPAQPTFTGGVKLYPIYPAAMVAQSRNNKIDLPEYVHIPGTILTQAKAIRGDVFELNFQVKIRMTGRPDLEALVRAAVEIRDAITRAEIAWSEEQEASDPERIAAEEYRRFIPVTHVEVGDDLRPPRRRRMGDGHLPA